MVKRVLSLAVGCLVAAMPSLAQEINKVSFLPTGTMLRATITNAIFSYNLTTPVIAELDEGGAFKDRLVLPPHTKLLGRAMVLKSHDRVNVEFDRAVLPDGTELDIGGLALSPDGSAGIKGKVEKYKDSAVASAALKGAVTGLTTMTSAAINPVAAQTGQAVAEETVRQVDTTQQEVDTSISIPGFTRCFVYLERRLELKSKEEEANGTRNPERAGQLYPNRKP